MKKSNETKKIIINGDFTNFTGSTLYINTSERTLADMGRRELKNLYKSSEDVRSAAKRKAQEKHLEDIENYLYKTIPIVIQTVRNEMFKNNFADTFKDAYDNIPTFDNSAQSDIKIDCWLHGLTGVIGSTLKKIKDSYIQDCFLDNPTDLFKEEEQNGTKTSYKIKNGKIVKIVEETA